MHIRFFNRAVIEGFYVEDLHGDTLLYVDELDADFDNIYLGFTHYNFDKVVLRNGQFNVRQFEGEEDLNIQFILDVINGPRDPNDTSKYNPPRLFFWDLQMENLAFTYEYRDTIPDTGFGMNYDHIRIRELYGEVKRFMIIDDSLTGELRNMRCREEAGFPVLNMNTDFVISYTMMDFANLEIRTPKSRINGRLHFDYDNYDQLSDFITDVPMRGRFKNSSVNLAEVAFFAPELRGLNHQVEVSGSIKGTVDNLSGKNILLQTGTDTRFAGNFRITGLPDIESSQFDFSIKELRSNKADIESIPSYPFITGEYSQLPDFVAGLGNITFRGRLQGYLDDLKCQGAVFSNAGELETDIKLQYNPDVGLYVYSAELGSDGFNAGAVAGAKSKLGPVALKATINGQGLRPGKISASLNADISSAVFNQYNYSNLTASGTANGDLYSLSLKVLDPNLRMNFNGSADLSGEDELINIHAGIDRLNMNAVNLLRRDSTLILSTELIAELRLVDADFPLGRAELSNSTIQYGSDRYRVEDLLLETADDYGTRSLRLYSDMADASITGEFSFPEIPDAVSRVLNSFFPTANLIPVAKKPAPGQEFTYSLKIKDGSLLSALVVPGLRFSSDTRAEGSFSSRENSIYTNAVSSSLSLGSVRLSNVMVDANARGGKLRLTGGVERIFLTDSVTIGHARLGADVITDNADIKLEWASAKNRKGPDAELNLRGWFEDSKVFLKAQPSLILIQDTLWRVTQENLVIIDTASIEIMDLDFLHGKEFVRIDGKISQHPEDELDIILDNFELANLNPFLSGSGIKIKGNTQGIITLADLWNQPHFKSNLSFNSISVNGDLIGNGQLVSKWEPENSRIFMDGALRSGTEEPRLAFSGYYSPNRQTNSLDFDFRMRNIHVKLFERYLNDIFSSINSGLADGSIHLSGTPSKPVLDGQVMLKRTSVTIDVLNTTYSFSHEFTIAKNLISAKNIQVSDVMGNTANLDFKLTHNYFDDLYFDIFLRTSRILALRTNESQSDLFYGTAYGSGTFRAYGPLENIVMDINARTEKGTVFNLPLSGTGEVSQQDFITFEKKGTIQPAARRKRAMAQAKGYELKLNLEVTNEAEALLIFDPKVGDLIRGNGTGNLRLEVTESGEFNMYGDYVVNSGNYLFTLQNVINKQFVIQPGGQISFKGDPYDADINITAVYKVRNSLYNLVKEIDSSAAVRRIVNIDVNMYLTDKLMKPQVKFDIVLPNADDETRNILQSQIRNEDDLNRQVFALIMLGSFYPNQGGANSIAGGGGANVSELISSQLSNMLSQLSDDVKLGVNYRQGNAYAPDELKVNLTTNLLNDRVTVDGNIGTGAGIQTTSQSTTTMVGEFNIEVKLNNDGSVRIKVFNRSNQYLLVYNAQYTQGIGLFYRREFDSLEDLRKKKNKAVVAQN